MITLKKFGRWYQFSETLNPKLEKVIDKTLSYVKVGSEFLPNPSWGQIHLYNLKKRAFPCGLISLVRPILKSWCNQYHDEWYEDENINLKPLPTQLTKLRDYQVEAFNTFWKTQGGLISLPTSAGKTMIAERIIASFPTKKILVVCPTKELTKQWKDELGNMIELKDIRIATYQKLYRELKTNKAQQLKDYSLVIFDECHHCSANSLYKIGLQCSNALMLGLTATEKRMDGAEMKIQAILGDIIYKVSIQDLVKKGYIVQGKVIIMDTPKYKAKPDEDFKKVYHSAIVTNQARNDKIRDIAIKECNRGTVIIICKHLEQGGLIYNSLKNTLRKVVYVHGTSKERDKTFEDIKAGKYDIVVATKVYGEGVSIPNLMTLILASGGKSSTEIIQTTGRLLRLFKNKDKAIIYDFSDSGRSISKHFKERLRIYEENGYEVTYG